MAESTAVSYFALFIAVTELMPCVLAIVKIQSRFTRGDDDAVWMMATGWLIRPDLIVTAGHVVFDRSRGYGAVTQLKCYIGYNGAGSVPKPGMTMEFFIAFSNFLLT